MDKITVSSELERFLQDQLCVGNQVKTILTNENNSSIILLEKPITNFDKEAIKRKYGLDLVSDRGGYTVSHKEAADKISFPAPFSLTRFLFNLSAKDTISVLIGIMTFISICALRFWDIQLSNYLESASLGFLKSYTINNLSAFTGSYLLIELGVAAAGYLLLLLLNFFNKTTLTSKTTKLSKKIAVQAWVSTFLSLFVFWSIFLISTLLGYTWLNTHPTLMTILFFAPSLCTMFLLPKGLRRSLTLFNIMSSLWFLFYLLGTYSLFHTLNFNWKYTLIVLALIPLFVFSLYLRTFLKAFPQKENAPLVCYLSFLFVPIILLLSSLTKEDSMTWSGLGERQETFIVNSDFKQALTEASSFTVGNNVLNDLNYNPRNRTITAWVVLEIGNKLVLSHAEGAKTEYYFTESPYRLVNIFNINS